ncbi:MAG: bifunctional folylpolyglutamate synthase/dihydrofolate synthase [Firmicutes bacterium]|nr:bifunctional folylpolyglutamate synthase/dihydrofolate synthase [Bacillota bacterium]
MTFDEALNYITEALKFGINPGLQKIEAICKELDNPQLKYHTIQITGTNGKTSTTWMTRDLLVSLGLKTGCYTSPHLHSYRERITVNGELIPEDAFAGILKEIQPVLDKVKDQHGDLTEFEILTAMAFYYFAREEVDVAVFEVGLGGRWDATSMVQPKVAAITGISLDHTDRLGSTVEEIAWDKAHIIKPGCTAVVGRVPAGALAKIKERLTLVGVQARLFGQDFAPEAATVVKNEGSRFMINGLYARYEGIKLPVFGLYQVSNFTMATAIVESFLGRALDAELLKSTASKASCPGRFELVSKEPLIVLDGAHNPEGAQMLVKGLPQSFNYRDLIIVLAVSSDKDIEQMLTILGESAALLVLSQNKSYRSASTNQLIDIAKRTGNRYIIEPDLEKAIDLAIGRASAGDLVSITGSLYTVADAREYLLKVRS